MLEWCMKALAVDPAGSDDRRSVHRQRSPGRGAGPALSPIPPSSRSTVRRWPWATRHAKRGGTSVQVVGPTSRPRTRARLTSTGRVDLLVCNPPYPGAAELKTPVAGHDPHHALFGGPDGGRHPRRRGAGGALAASRRRLRRGARRHHLRPDRRTHHADGTLRRCDRASGPRRTAPIRDRYVRRVNPTHEPGIDCADESQRATGIALGHQRGQGGRLVVLLPTDTVYGIGADAFDSAAVAALLAAKGRGRDMPVPCCRFVDDHRRPGLHGPHRGAREPHPGVLARRAEPGGSAGPKSLQWDR